MNKPLIHDDMTADEIQYRASYVWGETMIKEHGFDAWLKEVMPRFIEMREFIPEGHELHNLIERWDPETRDFRPEDYSGPPNLHLDDTPDFLK